MHIDDKTKIIVRMLDAAARAMGSRVISRNTLYAGVERYLQERDPPKLPSQDSATSKIIKFKKNNVIQLDSRRK